MSAVKRLDLVIVAADRAGVPVVIAGGGPEEARLREIAARVSVPVHFELQPSRSRLRDLYRAAAAVVFPPFEDFGIVPVEAQACGTPVVALGAGGSLDTVTSGVTGIHAPSSSWHAFGDAIRLALETDFDTAKVRAHAETFSEEAFVSRFRSWSNLPLEDSKVLSG